MGVIIQRSHPYRIDKPYRFGIWDYRMRMSRLRIVDVSIVDCGFQISDLGMGVNEELEYLLIVFSVIL